MKKNRIAIVLFVFLFFGISNLVHSQKVYLGTSGNRYHKKSCKESHSEEALDIADAKRKGYFPCQICLPEKEIYKSNHNKKEQDPIDRNTKHGVKFEPKKDEDKKDNKNNDNQKSKGNNDNLINDPKSRKK